LQRRKNKASVTAPRVILAESTDLLRSTALTDVATIGPHGEPRVNPVGFGGDGEHLTFGQSTNWTQRDR
jgi:hypothetical protein